MLVVCFLFSLNARAEDPHFQSGDIIFQASKSKQSTAILWATKSVYSHVGIVEVVGDKKYVIETLSVVKKTPLKEWTARGRLSRYAVYRYDGITPKQQKAVVASAKKYLGRGYDVYFTSNNNELYCSELVHLAYKDAGIKIGSFQKVQDLDIDNIVVHKLVEQRWRQHPLCRKGVKNFETCWARILDDDLISPDRVSEDTHLQKVWSNFTIL